MSSKSVLEMFDNEENSNAWVVTFADIMTLILVFFILLYALSDSNEQSFYELISNLVVFDGQGNQISVIDYAAKQGRNPEPLRPIEEMIGLNQAQLAVELLKPAMVVELESMINYTDLAEGIELSYDSDQINIQIDGRFLFESGKAELKDSALIIFANLGQLFRQYADYRIAIRGHTDDRNIETIQFPSNWELSAVRATTVLRYFIKQGMDPERMSATGYADIIPLVNNDTAENRARNRRVEFVLEKEK